MLVTALVFIFLLGLCVGSFLNVVAYRLPLGMSLVHPPSRCPKCGTRLAAYDNVPVLGWLWLAGKCRYCRLPISPRYPIVEAVTGLLFLLVAAGVFHFGLGPCFVAEVPRFSDIGLPLPSEFPPIERHWPILVPYLALVGCLVAASLIDFDRYEIPLSICVLMQLLGLAAYALIPRGTVGALHVSAGWALPAAGGLVGLLLSMLLLRLRVLPMSFPKGEPMMLDHATWQAEIDAAKAENRPPSVPPEPPIQWTRGMLATEISKEVLFLLPPILGAVVGLVLAGWSPSLAQTLAGNDWVSGFLGAALGGMVGGGVIWVVRILGTLGFGKVAMGLGDVHLMAGAGALAGPLVASLAMFPAAFVGLGVYAYAYFTRNRREIPFGPYLAVGTLVNLLLACHIHKFLLLYFQHPVSP
jgi:leader peptidase (prepilin peptidase) / N-methyltransferase